MLKPCPSSEPGRTWAQGPAGGGQRAAPRHLGAVRTALRAPAGAGDIRTDRGQRGHFQLHRTAGRRGPCFLALQGERQGGKWEPCGTVVGGERAGRGLRQLK